MMIMHLKNRKLFPENNNQEGQALLFVIVALTVALAVGISTAFRTLSSVSRVTTTDTSVRVLAAAEGGLEHFLSYTTPQLNTALGTCNSLDSANPDDDCVVTFTPVATDNITARAIVMVEEFRGGPASDNYRYRTNIPVGDSITINLSGATASTSFTGSLHVCWQGASDLFYYYYNENDMNTMNSWRQGVLCPRSPGESCYSGSSNVSGVTPATTPPPACSSLGSTFHGYTFTIPSGNPGTLRKGLVLTALNADVAVAVQNGGGTALFPQILGYKITSRGELLENATVKTTKTTSVTRSLPYLSPNLIFGLFADTGIDTLDTYMEVDTSPTCAATGSSCATLPCCDAMAGCVGGTCLLLEPEPPVCKVNGLNCVFRSECCSNICTSGVCGGGSAI